MLRSATATLRYTSSRADVLLMTLMAISFISSVLTGIFLNSACATADFSRAAALRVCHAVSAVTFLVLMVRHLWLNRRWYRGLCLYRPTTWAGMASNRWLTLQTLFCAVMAVTGTVIGVGGHSAIGFHQGCGLIFALLVLVHMTVRLSRR